MRSHLSLLTAVVLAGLAWKLFREARVAYGAEVVDQSRVLALFGGLVLVGVALGILFVVSILPRIADWIGNFFYIPGGEIEEAPHARALAAVARGEYAEAIEAYRAAWRRDPADTHALSEMARLYAEKLDDPASAAATLETALEQVWTTEDAAFLSGRLAEIYWAHLHDATRARARWQAIIDLLPGTQQSANARHRLQEIARQLAAGE